jgi:hypothetical protein
MIHADQALQTKQLSPIQVEFCGFWSQTDKCRSEGLGVAKLLELV